MRKLTNTFLLAVVMCMLLVCAGCASQNAASSASASASAESSATTSQASSANSTETSAGAGATVDPSNMTDGEYSVEVSLQGGSGKASVESPTKLIVEGGKMKAVIVWSSSNYDLMVVDGTEYHPVPRPGNSTFEIPIAGFDKDLPVQAETTAMSEPHMIDYTLNFSSASLKVWES